MTNQTTPSDEENRNSEQEDQRENMRTLIAIERPGAYTIHDIPEKRLQDEESRFYELESTAGDRIWNEHTIAVFPATISPDHKMVQKADDSHPNIDVTGFIRKHTQNTD